MRPCRKDQGWQSWVCFCFHLFICIRYIQKQQQPEQQQLGDPIIQSVSSRYFDMYESAFVYKYIVKYTCVHNKQYKYTVSLFIYIFKMMIKEKKKKKTRKKNIQKQIFYVFF